MESDMAEVTINPEEIGAQINQLREEIAKVIVGQEEIVEQMLICFFSSGHALLSGVPGLGKTLMIKAIAHAIDMQFSRVQFVPDLMPSDILGAEIIQEEKETGRKEFVFRSGPVFTNIFMADEINRASPKTQSALLEVMQEKKISMSGKNMEVGKPFNVFATQNPLEFEGTYPLPEAQLDRFLMNINIGYPTREEEVMIAGCRGFKELEKCGVVMSAEHVLQIQDCVYDIPISKELLDWSVVLVRASRPEEEDSSELAGKYVKWGASPRAVQALIQTAKASALLEGRFNVARDDIEKCFVPIMRHRVILNYKADADNISVDDLLNEMLVKCTKK